MLKKFYYFNIKVIFKNFYFKNLFFINFNLKDTLYNIYFFKIKKKKFLFFFKFTYNFYKKKKRKYIYKNSLNKKPFTKGYKFFTRKRRKLSYIKNIYFFKKKHFFRKTKLFYKYTNFNFFFFKYLKKNSRKKNFFFKYLKYRIKNARNYLGGLLFNTLKSNKLSEKFNIFRKQINSIKIPIFFNNHFFFKKFFLINKDNKILPYLYKNSKFNFFFNYDNFYFNYNFLKNFSKNGLHKNRFLLNKKNKKKVKLTKNWKKDIMISDYIVDYYYDYYPINNNMDILEKNLFYWNTKINKLNVFFYIKEYYFFFKWFFIYRFRFEESKPQKWRNLFSYFKKLNIHKFKLNKYEYSRYKRWFKTQRQKNKTKKYLFRKNNFLIFWKGKYKINRRFFKKKLNTKIILNKLMSVNFKLSNTIKKYLRLHVWRFFKFIIFMKLLKKKILMKKYKFFKLNYLNQRKLKKKIIKYNVEWHESSNVEKFKKKYFFKRKKKQNIFFRKNKKKILFNNSPNMSIIYIDFLINTYVFKKNIYFFDFFKYFYMNILNIRTYNWKQII